MNARQTALLILNEIEQKKTYANLSIKKMLDMADAGEKALATELVYGVLRYKLNLDYIRNSFSKIKENKISLSVKNILRMGIYQIIYLSKIPDSAACNESVKLVYKYSHKGAVGFVNAVLRNVVRNKENISYPKDFKEMLMYKYSYPEDITEIVVRDYGENAESILKALNKNKKMCIRPNLLKISDEEFEKFMENYDYAKGDGCYYVKNMSVDGLCEFEKGLFSVQDRASMMCAELLNPARNDKVLDLCAAPGGKSSYMAELMGNEGEIISCDLHSHRTELIDNTAKRLGIKIITSKENDALLINDEFIDAFDKVLVDVPCSGLGVISSKPDIKWAERDFESLLSVQEKILENALLYVKKGGVLVYSTCTINKDENERLLKKVVENNENFAIEKSVQLIPCDETDGFYMCRIKRGK